MEFSQFFKKFEFFKILIFYNAYLEGHIDGLVFAEGLLNVLGALDEGLVLNALNDRSALLEPFEVGDVGGGEGVNVQDAVLLLWDLHGPLDLLWLA